MRYLTGTKHETYQKICRYGFTILIVAIPIPMVRDLLITGTEGTLLGMMVLVGGFGSGGGRCGRMKKEWISPD